MKRALITSISGQDGSYLAGYLLELGYEVFGLIRRDPQSVRWLGGILARIEPLSGDLRDPASLEIAFQKAWPDEVYNLGGQVFVPTSWQIPEETWGFAGDYVKAMHAMLQQETPGSYVIATGESHSVADFVATVLAELNGITDVSEAAHLIEAHVEVDPRLMRTGEIHDLRGAAGRARSELAWAPTVDFRGLVRMMVAADLATAGTKLPDRGPRG